MVVLRQPEQQASAKATDQKAADATSFGGLFDADKSVSAANATLTEAQEEGEWPDGQISRAPRMGPE